MKVKVYYQGLGWYSGRMKGDTLVYSRGKEKDPEYPNIYLLMKEGVRGRVSKALNIEPELVTVL
jgi:hypothetical protein